MVYTLIVIIEILSHQTIEGLINSGISDYIICTWETFIRKANIIEIANKFSIVILCNNNDELIIIF